MTIYIDFISTLKILGTVAIYTGGTNYAEYIVEALYRNKKDGDEFKLLLPQNYKISCKNDFFTSFNVIRVKDLLDVEYAKDDILYLPQVNGTLLMQVPKIKKEYPFLKIYGTLHDRQHNIVKYDYLDTVFETGLKKIRIFSWMHYKIKKLLFNILYNRCIKSLDKVFTVSNYSMQLLNNSSVKFIKYYIQGSYMKNNTCVTRGDYVLFVGGNRGEKNLFRALLAFRGYKSLKKSSLSLVVTGIPEKLKVKLSRLIDLKDDIILKPYVSDKDLALLYSNCRYVIFLSKAEGYGCPVREAMQYGKVVLASRVTSIPEVAGAAMYYVDPFNVDSIISGMIYLENETNLERYEKYILERKTLVDRMAQQDLEIFIDDFFE